MGLQGESRGLPIVHAAPIPAVSSWLRGFVRPSTCLMACGQRLQPPRSLRLRVRGRMRGQGGKEVCLQLHWLFHVKTLVLTNLGSLPRAASFVSSWVSIRLHEAPLQSALSRPCRPLTLPVCLFPVLQGLFQEWPGSDAGRWVSWLPLATSSSPAPLCTGVSAGTKAQPGLRARSSPAESRFVFSSCPSSPAGRCLQAERLASPSLLVRPRSRERGGPHVSRIDLNVRGWHRRCGPDRRDSGLRDSLLPSEGGVPLRSAGL